MQFDKRKTYDELQIGEEASFSKTISESDVYLFDNTTIAEGEAVVMPPS